MKVKSESEVAQSCPTLSNPKDGSLPGSSAHGIFQARVLGVGCHCLLRCLGRLKLPIWNKFYTLTKKNMLILFILLAEGGNGFMRPVIEPMS